MSMSITSFTACLRCSNFCCGLDRLSHREFGEQNDRPPPWQEFRVGTPSTRANWFQTDCQPLTAVAHVAHVPIAVRIVEDRQLRADLVYDESRLNTERIRVVWLSPNDWENAGGFRYGNVRFWFDWESLITGRRYYWVESMAYGIKACRILVTEIDYSATLEVYDPTVGDGPWWLAQDGQHYWNGKYCLEFMYEGDLPTSRAQTVDFVRHHANRCNIDPRTCGHRGSSKEQAGAAFIAAIVSNTSSCQVAGSSPTRGAPHAQAGAFTVLRRASYSCATKPQSQRGEPSRPQTLRQFRSPGPF